MTSANILSLGTPEAANTNAAAPKEAKGKSVEETASVFAGLVTQSISAKQAPKPVMDSAAKKKQQGMAVQSSNDAYDRYQYKDNTLEQGKTPTLTDKIDSAKEELTEFEETVVEKVCEKFDVSGEDVRKVLDELGLTVFDLLNPKNLALAAAELTGAKDAMELLVSADFQQLLEDIGQLGSELMKQLDLQVNQLDELVAQMDVLSDSERLEQTEELSGDKLQEQMTAQQKQTAAQPEKLEEAAGEQPVVRAAEAVEANEAGTQKPQEAVVSEKPEVSVAAKEAAGEQISAEEQKEIVVEDLRDTAEGGKVLSETVQAGEKDDAGTAEHDFSGAGQREQKSHITERPEGQPATAFQNVESAVVSETIPETTSYSDIDVLDIIRQVAENVRVVLDTDATTMEMQLNPENLGKIYVNISTKEGAVHAQLAAQNEVVKEALEAQLATLRENLSQAGVKVDAVEVTIASHEFERNLEQNEQGQNQQQNEEQKAKRRNLKLDELDELQGLMSEEEALVARMMRDNGNSVDYTA